MRVGENEFYNINWTGWLANYWAPDALVGTDDEVRPSRPNGYQYACAIVGEAGCTEPDWPAAGKVNDGSTALVAELIDITSLSATVDNAVWTPPIGVGVGDSVVCGQGASALIDATEAIADTAMWLWWRRQWTTKRKRPRT
ncbi:MAG: hypothetical protein ACLQFT_12470 [Steroidobacteraceae bacterium]